MVKEDYNCDENLQRHSSIDIEAESTLASKYESSGEDNGDTVNSDSPLVKIADTLKTIQKEGKETDLKNEKGHRLSASENLTAPSNFGVLKGFLLKQQRLLAYVWLATVTTACFALVFLFVLKTGQNEPPPEVDRMILQFDKENSKLFSAGNQHSSSEKFSWDTFLNHMGHLHFEVGGKDTRQDEGGFELQGKFLHQSLKILGRPSFCTERNYQTPNSITFLNVTHLYLNNMDNCHHYVHLILKEWRYPKVKHLKLHKVLIREEEFFALGKFIEKHNETLTRVEIDESYLCPSPTCDAGMLNFPEHDFQLIIRRRKESSDWFY